MNYCTANICTSSHCGSACDRKCHCYLQMHWDIGHKTFDLPFFVLSSSHWLSFTMTGEIIIKINFNSWSITFTFTAHIVFFLLIMILTRFCQRKGRFLVTFFLKSKRRFGILRKYGWNSLSISILPIQSQWNLLTYQLGTKIARASTLLKMDRNLEKRDLGKNTTNDMSGTDGREK